MSSSSNSSHQPYWKRLEARGHTPTPRFNLYYKWNVLDVIRDILGQVGGPDLLHRFSDGCFGHLLRWRKGPSASQALYELMTYEISMPGASKHEIWFSIGGQPIRMSPVEYALVTGFTFGSSNFDIEAVHDPSGRGHYMRFCNGALISHNALLTKFSEKVVDQKYHDDYLKVANILALHLFVVGQEERRKVDPWLWVLVDDLEAWDRFPWGSYTYGAFFHYIKFFPTKKEDLKPKLHFYGPVWALQIWAYEAIPLLGDKCTEFVDPQALPRCLKRRFKRPTTKDFEAFFRQQLQCATSLTPSDVELHTVYWMSTQIPQPVGVRYIPTENPVKPVKIKESGLHILHRASSASMSQSGAAASASASRHHQVRSKNAPEPEPEPEPERERVVPSDTSRERIPLDTGKRARAPSESSSSSSGADRDIPRAGSRAERKLIRRVTQSVTNSVREMFNTEMMPQIKEYLSGLFRSHRGRSSSRPDSPHLGGHGSGSRRGM